MRCKRHIRVDNWQDHATERGSGFALSPQLRSSSDYYTANGVITVVRYPADSSGVTALELSERVNVGDPPKHQETIDRVRINLNPDGTVDLKRQFDQVTGEEAALAHFLVPNFMPPDGSQKTWSRGGVVDRVDDHSNYTMIARDADGTAVLTFEQRVKGAAGYSARGKVLYDTNRGLPLKAHTEIHTVDLTDTTYENIDFALNTPEG